MVRWTPLYSNEVVTLFYFEYHGRLVSDLTAVCRSVASGLGAVDSARAQHIMCHMSADHDVPDPL
jgi:hypothetical protein